MGGGPGSSNSSSAEARIVVTIVKETEIMEKARREATLSTVSHAIAQILSPYLRSERTEIVREVQRLLQCRDKVV